MTERHESRLSKRERQVMDIVYRRKEVSAQDVWQEVPDFPSYSAVRSVLSILEEKGLLTHWVEGKKYIYSPTIPHKKAMSSAVKQLLSTYFDNSLERAVTAMLEIHTEDLTERDLERLAHIIEQAKKEE
jgi:BlaI family penicillinase repressor